MGLKVTAYMNNLVIKKLVLRMQEIVLRMSFPGENRSKSKRDSGRSYIGFKPHNESDCEWLGIWDWLRKVNQSNIFHMKPILRFHWKYFQWIATNALIVSFQWWSNIYVQALSQRKSVRFENLGCQVRCVNVECKPIKSVGAKAVAFMNRMVISELEASRSAVTFWRGSIES